MAYKVKSFRATFEDILVAQESMRKMLEKLMNEDRALKEDERGAFLDLIYRSCLGMESKFNFEYPGKKATYLKKPFNHVVFDLFYQKGNKFKLKHEAVEEQVNMSSIWKAVLIFMFRVWGIARERASSMSVERIPFESIEPEKV